MESFPFHTVTLVLDIIYFVGFCGMLVFVVFAEMIGGMSHGSNINENERMVKERMAIYSGLCQIDRDRVIVGKQRGFYIVNVKKCEIEKEVHDGQMGYVYCFLPLWENMVVMGNGKGGFAFMMLTIINFLY